VKPDLLLVLSRSTDITSHMLDFFFLKSRMIIEFSSIIFEEKNRPARTLPFFTTIVETGVYVFISPLIFTRELVEL
jgi:hypothetical protein